MRLLTSAEEEFLAARIADPMLRAREVIEALSLAVAAGAAGAAEAAAALVEDGRRAPAVRRLAAAAFFRLAGAAAARKRFAASTADELLTGLAAGDPREALRALDAPASDEEAATWIAVAHTLALREALPALEKNLRDPERHPDVRRQAAETWRALTAGDERARAALRASAPGDGSLLDELVDTAAGAPQPS